MCVCVCVCVCLSLPLCLLCLLCTVSGVSRVVPHGVHVFSLSLLLSLSLSVSLSHSFPLLSLEIASIDSPLSSLCQYSPHTDTAAASCLYPPPNAVIPDHSHTDIFPTPH